MKEWPEERIVEQLKDESWHAVEDRDEAKLERTLLRAMNLFLKKKIFINDLHEISLAPLVAPIHLKWKNEFQFRNRRLKYVCEELQAIEVEDKTRVRDNVKRFIKYLKGEDYEKID